MSDLHPSRSDVQQRAEAHILERVADTLGTTLAPQSLSIDGARVQIDGVSPDRRTLVEVYAHVGPLKGGQPKKLIADAFKLGWAGAKIDAERLVLAVADEHAEEYLRRPGAWLTAALRDSKVEVVRATLTEVQTNAIRAAQALQYR